MVRLAGAVGVEHGGRQATEHDLQGRQPRLAFAVLVWERARPVTHDELGDILWPSGPPSTWQPALRTIVSRVRAVFDRVGLPGAEIVSGRPGRYELILPQGAVVDMEEARAALEEGERLLEEGGTETARRLAGDARTILSRPLLPGVDSPWLDRRREELGVSYVRCLELLGECRRRAGEYDHAARAVEDLLALDPFRESGWRLLMQIHVDAGNIGEALRAFERCRRILAGELGADPATETRELHTRILQGTAASERTASERVSAGTEEPAGRRAAVVGPPYRGLEPFDEEHAPLFFGREESVVALVERLRVHRFVAVVGASGTGKSSLVRAGLLPALACGALPEADTWRRAIMVPGQDPLGSLRAALVECGPRADTQAALDRLPEDPAAVHAAACAILAGRPAGEQLLVVVDQFEEVFTLCRNDDARRMFVANLLEATRRFDARTVVVLTMRADFYPRAAGLPDLAAALSTSQFVVSPMDGEGLEQAIEQPARLAGLRFESGLVGRILTDVAGEPGALPLLQHALLEIYGRRTDNVMTRAAYDDVGRVSGAVARRAEMVWESLGDDERGVVRAILLRLTEPGVDTEDTRRRAPVSELVGELFTRGQVESVLRKLADARLVTTSADASTGIPYVEVAHEALIRGWPRLASWIEDNRAGLLIHRRLTDAAVQWTEHDRHTDYLYRGNRLTEAREWDAARHPDLNLVEREFLQASGIAEEAALRRRNRVRRLLLTGLSTGVAVVSLLALVAVVQRERADEQEQLARSRQVAAEAANQLSVDPELSLLLAIEAYEIAQTSEAESALRAAVARSHLRTRFPTEGLDPLVAVSPDGRLVAVSTPQDVITVWHTQTGERLARLTGPGGDPPEGTIDTIVFSPDATRLLASNMDGRAWIWDVPDGALGAELRWPKTGLFCCGATDAGAGWSPDGRRVVLSAPGAARVFDAEDGEMVLLLRPGQGDEAAGVLARARYSPDGRRIAMEGPNGTVDVLDAGSGRLLATLAGHSERLGSLRWSSDGTRILTGSEDATARLWDASTGRLLQTFGHDVTVRDAALSPDGTRVLTGDFTGEVAIWDAATGERLFDLAGHAARVNKVRFDPSGRLALTASFDGTARVWDVSTGQDVAVFAGTTQAVITAEFTPDGKHVVTAGDDARLWEIPQGATSMLRAHGAAVWDVAFSPDGETLVTGGLMDGTARLWDLRTRRQIASLDHDPAAMVSADISSDGRFVLTSDQYLAPGQASQADPARMWELPTGNLVREFPPPEHDPLGLCGGRCSATRASFSPDGRMVAVSGSDGRLRIFDAATGRTVHVLDAGQELEWAEWSPDGRVLLAIGRELPITYTPRLWDTGTWEELPPLPTEEGATPTRPRFSPDGHLLAIHRGGITKVYDVATGRPVAEFRHRGTARDAAFSPDGKLVVTASDAGASIWDLESQRHLVDLTDHPGEVFVVRFSPDGRIVTGGSDGAVRFFDCEVCHPIDRLLDLARERVTRQLTPTERARFLLDAD